MCFDFKGENWKTFYFELKIKMDSQDLKFEILTFWKNSMESYSSLDLVNRLKPMGPRIDITCPIANYDSC